MKITALFEKIKTEASDIVESLNPIFTTGPRCVLLLQRAKDGGSQKDDSRRTFHFDVYYTKEEMVRSLEKALLLHYFNLPRPTRVYLSVNERDQNVAARNVLETIVESFYQPEDNKFAVYKKLFKNPRTHLMQTNAKVHTKFLIDIDSDGTESDLTGPLLSFCGENNITVHELRPTKNGYHAVTDPFNPNILPKGIGEIKPDGLLCLKY